MDLWPFLEAKCNGECGSNVFEDLFGHFCSLLERYSSNRLKRICNNNSIVSRRPYCDARSRGVSCRTLGINGSAECVNNNETTAV